MRRVEVLLERTERESVPMGSGAGLGELGHLLPDRSQHKNLAVWLKAKANSVVGPEESNARNSGRLVSWD